MRNKRGKVVLWSKFCLKSLLKHGPKVDGSAAAEEDDESESESDDEDSVMRHSRSSCSSQASEAGYWSAGGQHRRHSSAMSAPADFMRNALSSKEQFRIFIGTWNVGGKLPEEEMNIEEWLKLTEPGDIYVIGLQEIVPLNAGNVLGVDDKSCVVRWLHLIHKALNPQHLSDRKSGLACPTMSAPRRKSRRSFSASLVDRSGSPSGLNDNGGPFNMGNDDLEFSFPLLLDEPFLPYSFGLSQASADDIMHGALSAGTDDPPFHSPPSFSMVKSSASSRSRYALVASKRMVGIFLSVWVRDNLCPHVRHVKISSVGCGIMGYLGNKGSISISLSLHQTTFCFICSHLTSGEKDGDELRRNDDVSVILKRTRFCKSSHRKERSLPDTILDHDRILWFGDLNYRLTLSSSSTKLLLARGDWEALLERDQLHIERRAGRVFKGWHEGKICFPPTYKYRTGSDSYAVERRKFGEKRRTPAWCDRILWYGKGLKQLEYVRAESNFSDHRPVYAVFLAAVDVPDPRKLRDFLT